MTTLEYIYPPLGDTSGGGFISLYGTGLTDVLSVTVGGKAVVNFTVIDDTRLDFTAPALSYNATPYDVVVLTEIYQGSNSNIVTGNVTYVGMANVGGSQTFDLGPVEVTTTLRGVYFAWDPSYITGGGVVEWDSDVGVTSAGGKVSQWNDRTAVGKNWVQAAAPNKPNYVFNAIQGKNRFSIPALRFDGINTFMTQAKTLMGGSYSVFMIGKSTNIQSGNGSGSGSAASPVLGDDQGSTGGVALALSLGQVQVNNYAGAMFNLFEFGNPNLNDNTPHVWGASHDSGTGIIQAYTDGELLYPTVVSALDLAAFGYSCLGSAGAAGHFDFYTGDIYSLILIPSIITDEDLQRLQFWADSKYFHGSYVWKQQLNGLTTGGSGEAPWSARDGAVLSYLGQTFVLAGGWNGGAPLEFDNKYTTNEVWTSVNRKVWSQVLTNDDTVPINGVRPRRRHAYPSTIHVIDGVPNIVIVNGDMWNDILGVGPGQGLYNQYPQDVWRSPDGFHWTLVNPNQTPWSQRTLSMLGSLNGVLYMMGGQTNWQDPDTALNDVWLSRDNGVTWSLWGNGPWLPRSDAKLVTWNEKIWMTGGFRYNSSGTAVAFNDVWTFDGSSWVQVTSNANWSGKTYMGTVVFDGMIWVMSGSDPVAGNTNEVWWSKNGTSWTQMTDIPWLPSHADGFALTDVPSVVKAAGNSTIAANQRDVWELLVYDPNNANIN